MESDKRWVDALHNEIGPLCQVKHVDIGPTKEWGYPVDETCRSKFPDYSAAIHTHQEAFDFILVDGRFRIACTLNAIKHCIAHSDDLNSSAMFINDFWDRPDYHVVLKYLDVIVQEETAGVFSIKSKVEVEKLESDLMKYNFTTL